MSRLVSDIIRIVSVTGIVFVHVSWPYYAQLADKPGAFFNNAVALMVQTLKPSTLIFLFLSGLAFSKRVNRENFYVLDFYENRLARILPPYLLFTAISVYMFRLETDMASIVLYIATGSASYQLYFIPLILFLYMLTPVLRYVSRSLLYMSVMWLVFVFLIMAVGAVYPGLSPYLDSSGDKNPLWTDYLLFGMPVFITGLWVGSAKWGKSGARMIFYFPLLAAGLAMVYADFYYRFGQGLHPDDAGRTWRMTILMLAMTVIFFLTRFPERDSGKLLKKLSRAGFAVYLFHPVVIEIMKPQTLNYPLVHIVLTIVFSWAGGLLIQEIALSNRYTAFLLGEGDHLFRSRNR